MSETPVYADLAGWYRFNIICLECWRSYGLDFLHLDCSGDYDVTRTEADELREWITGRYEWMIRTGQRAA